MIRRAIVAAVGESSIDLLSLDEVERAHEESRGGSCESSGCGSSGCGCRVSGRPFKAAPPKNIALKTGDTVEVSASAARAFTSFLIILGLPALIAAAGWFLIRTALPDASEALGALGAAGGFAAAVALILTIGAPRRGKRLPEIIAVVDQQPI